MIKLIDRGNYTLLYDLLDKVDSDFLPTLSSRVDLQQYSIKLLNTANVFGEFNNNKLIGAIAIYMNDEDNFISYCPFIAVLSAYRGKGISEKLLNVAINNLLDKKFKTLALTVRSDSPAFYLYNKVGFEIINVFKYPDTDIEGYKMEFKLQ